MSSSGPRKRRSSSSAGKESSKVFSSLTHSTSGSVKKHSSCTTLNDISDLEKMFNKVKADKKSLISEQKRIEEPMVQFRKASDGYTNVSKTTNRPATGSPFLEKSPEAEGNSVVYKPYQPPGDIITLNVGGTTYVTARNTLLKQPDTMLYSMFSGRLTLPTLKDDAVFIDRDGSLFRHILNFLRSGQLSDLSRRELVDLRMEAQYFAMRSLISLIDERLKDFICNKFAVLRYNENSNYNNLSWQGMTTPCSLTTGNRSVYKCIDEVLAEVDEHGWELHQLSGDGSSEGGWMYVFKQKARLPFRWSKTKRPSYTMLPVLEGES